MTSPLASLGVSSPWGTWIVEGDHDGLTTIHLPGARRRAHGAPSPLVRAAARQLEQYFAGRRTTFELDLHVSGTEFQTRVWTQLAGVPFGTTVTYRDLAEAVGHPRAYRAVGSTNAKNPFPVVIPCHRVVASGGLGGYAGGLDIKRGLLALEDLTL
ncbi:MAG: methylated-DNA--[protein]-cysteine S-methyltransferase [Acidobacteria bacterium]|nr:methylated-DNA--[protein]-cysteine S-methyltransferase [Acidobacteriota bacterium]